MGALLSSPRRSIFVTALFMFSIILGTKFLCVRVAAQDHTQAVVATPRPLITEAIDETRRSVLKGNTHPLARRQFDLGTAPASLPMERMLLVLKRSPEQETVLRKLLDDQQDKNSPNYHKWLTPEQFGAQFGPSDSDMQTITSWLQSHGFQVAPSKGRSVLELSGSASQVQDAFHTSIHKYLVNAEQHWANASDPSIPAALTGAVAGVMTLHNFTKKPALHFSGEAVPARMVQVPGKVRPQVTFPPQNGQPALNALAPQDYAVIYNITPVYNTYTGVGMHIGVIGRSNLFNNGQDVQDFFSQVGTGNSLGVPSFNIVLNGADPGDLGGGEEAEATLDSTWSGALAPGAAVSLVVSATTNTSDGVDLSEAYIVENNLTDIMTESFSACELFATDAQLAGQSALAEQAAAQGITYFVSSGDNGATACDDPNVAPATKPISVNFLASTAFNVAVGGTVFNENGNTSKYWLSTPPISETALSYIPEDVWNESSLASGLWSSSGGASAGNIQSGAGSTGGVPKPYWQSGVTGIPADNVRDIPDVSLTAAGHDPYLLCWEGSCTPDAQGNLFVYFISGTSASAPSFAGIMALIDQGAGSRQGLANYILYRLAAQQGAYPSQCNGSGTAAPPTSTCIFNDVTVGNNVVPGEVGTNYQAGSGYDLTTGLGSVNVATLQAAWSSVNFNPTTTTLTLNGGTAVSIAHGTSVPLTITVAPSSTTGTPPTPTGNVVLLTGNTIAPTTMDRFPLIAGQVTSQSTSNLPGGTYNVWAHYGGDTTYAPSDSTQTSVTVTAEPSTTTVSALTFEEFGSQLPFTNGAFGSFVYLRADVFGQSGNGHPTGSVTFSDTFAATIPGGSTFTLNNQGSTANPNGIFTFDAGTHTIAASYSGDSSFAASSTTQSQTFTITPGFFATLNSAPSTVTIAAPGGTGSTSITVVNSSGFSGTISLACSGLPSESKCTFSPASINGAGMANTTNVSITVTTTAPTARAQLQQTSEPSRWIAAMGLFLPAIFLVGTKRRNIGLPLILLLLMLIPACGGGGGHKPPPDPGTPAGTSSVTVSATGGAIVSQTGFTLVVQ
jgi:hypothetical protein